jgi:hypothetical protein
LNDVKWQMVSPLAGLILDVDRKEISVFDILVYVNPTIFRYINMGHLWSELFL